MPYMKLLVLSALTATLSLTSMTAISAEQEVNIYSARKEALIAPALEKFTQETGIKVNLVTGKADALLEKLLVEGSSSPADLLITTDAGRLHRAKMLETLQGIESDVLLSNIPANLRDQDNQWFGLTTRARPIFYAKDKVKPEELSTYEDLVDEKWQGRICVRSSSNIYNQSLVASMIDARGKEATLSWAQGLTKNLARKPLGGDTDQLKAAAAGLCDIAIANTYYFGRLVKSDKAADKAVTERLAIFWPNQAEDQRGTHVNVSGAAVTKYAPNKENAIRLIEFMSSPDIQAWYSDVNNEYPVIQDIETPATLADWGTFKSDAIELTKLGENNADAVKLMDKAGWK